MRYSLVKVLLTVSPFRPSFSPHPQHASTDRRFLSPLFSQCYELLFPQVFCFHNHLRCPLVFSSRCVFPRSNHKAPPHVTTFRMNTCKSVSKQSTLTTFRMNTYEKPRGGGPRHSPLLMIGVPSPPATAYMIELIRHLISGLLTPHRRRLLPLLHGLARGIFRGVEADFALCGDWLAVLLRFVSDL